jgi:hypothetical protein
VVCHMWRLDLGLFPAPRGSLIAHRASEEIPITGSGATVLVFSISAACVRFLALGAQPTR